jgi:hypothetical protein
MSAIQYRRWKILNDAFINGLPYIIVKAFIFLVRAVIFVVIACALITLRLLINETSPNRRKFMNRVNFKLSLFL